MSGREMTQLMQLHPWLQCRSMELLLHIHKNIPNNSREFFHRKDHNITCVHMDKEH
ncbi:Hypothetical protein CINCED_3A017189 [Cinara cedri]|uniref:Uncharacterized protein n=1 Tax=Cinara cedri TaxID=506608 RepID=A0A5E4NSX2_9HEMI|nr:Hypothetical protein CINCED_3A017189 [Cinara cedri]